MKITAILQRFRERVAVKLGLLLLSVFLLIIFSVGNILYSLFLNFYLSHVTEELVQRGHSHASVLSDHFFPVTIEHVIRMEKGSRFMVVILNKEGNVIASSASISPLQRDYLKEASGKKEGQENTIEKDWDTTPFLVSHSPIMQNGKTTGEVVMFSPTEPIRQAVRLLQWMLMITGIVTVLVVSGLLFIISRMVVRPLIEMKQATSEIAQGRYSTRVPVLGNDEVAQLAHSINHMSNEIQFYQNQRNEFLADIGHELRTPITYLKGYSEVLLRNDYTPDELTQSLTIIYEQSNRLQRLVQDLFDLARMEQGNFSFCFVPLSLEDVVTDVLSLVESSMDEKKISLEYEPPAMPMSIEGDKQRLEQVLLNILENARRYTPSGGKVYVRLNGTKTSAEIQIEDTGPGISSEELPFIMERLYRVEKSRSQETGGAGLGLAISKKIVEAHHGSLHVESEVGVGTKFTIQLPLKK
ncbi:sensor histidine kinase [Aneurinibacillus terranovensis]|uniref:sensor histidine kinase n=1 Tax=Aneurinibacillus terranovensis TaxID=278991 RepID=UPI0003F635CC|nr:HAMP domain-containing sensor histidine kinase [Aneurinibacillus terranovensis]